MKQMNWKNIKKMLIMSIWFALIGGVATVGSLSAVLGSAFFFERPIIFLSVGAVAFLVLYAIGVGWILWRSQHMGNRFRVLAIMVGLVLFVTLSAELLTPLSLKQDTITTKGLKYWQLPNGLRIAYIHLPSASGQIKKPPVIFVHGGPGTPDMTGDSQFFKQLTKEGYDVYIYDEVGSGHSSRLKDPRQYTVQRDVADLEFIRQKINSDKMVLIGHSYGSVIVANYLTSHAKHVEKVVFSSPGALNPSDKSGGDLKNRIEKNEKIKMYKEMFQLRVMMVYGLLQINPVAAHSFVGDQEMDARMDKVYNYSKSALHCKGLPSGPSLSRLGFYANQTPQSAGAISPPDPRKDLSKLDTPSLIMKGACDYLSWSSAIDYKQALPHAKLVYFPHAGHNIYQDQPTKYMSILKAFLKDNPLSGSVYTDNQPPSDFEGRK